MPNLFAQNEKTVLVEHFTQASCPPCAAYNLGFQTTLDANANSITSICYQISFPSFDPMYFDNTTDANARTNFYNIGGVPIPVLQGTPNASISNGSFNNAHNNSSPFVINLSADFSQLTARFQFLSSKFDDYRY